MFRSKAGRVLVWGGMFTSRWQSDLYVKPFFFGEFRCAWAAKINRRGCRDGGKVVIQGGLTESAG